MDFIINVTAIVAACLTVIFLLSSAWSELKFYRKKELLLNKGFKLNEGKPPKGCKVDVWLGDIDLHGRPTIKTVYINQQDWTLSPWYKRTSKTIRAFKVVRI